RGKRDSGWISSDRFVKRIFLRPQQHFSESDKTSEISEPVQCRWHRAPVHSYRERVGPIQIRCEDRLLPPGRAATRNAAARNPDPPLSRRSRFLSSSKHPQSATSRQ